MKKRRYGTLPLLVLVLVIATGTGVIARAQGTDKDVGHGRKLPPWMAAGNYRVDDYGAYEDERALREEGGKFSSLSSMKRGNILLKGRGAVLTGCKTLLDVDAREDAVMTLSVDCKKDYGDYKIIRVGGGEVETLSENMESGRISFDLKKGKNLIRLVGKPAAFREIRISYLTKDYDKLNFYML